MDYWFDRPAYFYFNYFFFKRPIYFQMQNKDASILFKTEHITVLYPSKINLQH